MTYAATEIQGLLKRGPHAGEDFFRMKVTGNGETRWVNITPAQLASIGAVLSDDPTAEKVTDVPQRPDWSLDMEDQTEIVACPYCGELDAEVAVCGEDFWEGECYSCGEPVEFDYDPTGIIGYEHGRPLYATDSNPRESPDPNWMNP